MMKDRSNPVIRFLATTAAASLAALLFLALIPKDPANALLLGYSRSRLLLLAVLAAWFTAVLTITLLYRSRPSWRTRLEHLIEQISSDRSLLDVIFYLSAFSASILTYLTFLWSTTSDNALKGLLFRVLPFILLGLVISLQSLAALRPCFGQKAAGYWGMILAFAAGILLLEIVSFPLIDRKEAITVYWSLLEIIPFIILLSIILPKAREDHRCGLLFVFLLALFARSQTLFLLPIYSNDPLQHTPLVIIAVCGVLLLLRYLSQRVKWNPWPVILLLLFVILAAIYYGGADIYARVKNTDVTSSDQKSFLDFALEVKKSDFTYLGTRARYPLYPYLQALFIDLEADSQLLFEQGKQLNIVLSLVLLAATYFFAKRYLPKMTAYLFTLIIMFSFFLFKSPHYQVETLFYFMAFIGFVLLVRMIESPSIPLAIGTGIFLGLIHLTKASINPAIFAFSTMYLLKLLTSDDFKQALRGVWTKQLLMKSACLLILLAVFFSSISFFLVDTKRIYGSYFYDVNYLIFWTDGWFDARDTVMAAGAREHYPDLPPEEIPGPQKYFREHTIADAVERIRSGYQDEWMYITNPYGRYSYLLIYTCTLLVLSLAALPAAGKIIKDHLFTFLFGAAYFGGFSFLYAWWSYVNGGWHGARFTYSLYLPFFFSIMLFLHILERQHPVIRIYKVELHIRDVITVLSLVVLILLFIDIDTYAINRLLKPGTWYGK